MHASSAARFDHSVRDILGLLKVPGRRSPNADLYKLLRSWLIDTHGRRWLLILDNADEAEYLLEPPAVASQDDRSIPTSSGERRLDYIPVCDHGTVLITTRRRDMCLKMAHRNNLLEVLPMNAEHALEMMQKKIGVQDQKDDIMHIATALGFMPLAMAQAAAYIHRRAPRCSVQQYTEKLHRSQKSKLSLLNRDETDLRRDREANNSIISTWQISFEHVRNDRPSAADLLSFMSFFDGQAIPEALLLSSLQLSSDNVSEISGISDLTKSNLDDGQSVSDSNKDKLEEDIQLLRDYSFISVTSDPEIFEMHALVQLATQKWLDANGRHSQWKSRFIEVLSHAFPKFGSENWPSESRALFPHAMSALQLDAVGTDAEPWLAGLLYDAGFYANCSGAYANAERLMCSSLSISSRLFGDEHPRSRRAMSALAATYRYQMRYKEAEQLQLRLLDLTKSACGEAHWSTSKCMTQLSFIYLSQNRLEEAEQLSLQVLELAGDHETTLDGLNMLAEIRASQGRPEEAGKLLLLAADIGTSALGYNSVVTIDALVKLGGFYLREGRLNEAEITLSRVQEENEIKLGSNHTQTLRATCDMGTVYLKQGRLDEALRAFSRALDGMYTVLGSDHRDTLYATGQIAEVYKEQGRLNEAEETLIRVMEAQKSLFGLDNLGTILSLFALVKVQILQGRVDAAVISEQILLDAHARMFGIAGVKTLHCMESFASKLRQLGRKRSAMELMVRCAAISSEKLGPSDPSSVRRDAQARDLEAEDQHENYVSEATVSRSSMVASGEERGEQGSVEERFPGNKGSKTQETNETPLEEKSSQVKVWPMSDCAPAGSCEKPPVL